MTINYADIGAAAALGEDQTDMKEGGGGFDRPVPAEGACTLRLQQYLEMGVQHSKSAKFPKPSQQVIARFEVNSPKHMIEYESDTGTKHAPNTITLYLHKGGATSKYGKLFKALNYSGRFNHFAEMVGQGAWKAEITHNVTNPGTDTEKTYANLDKNGGWTFDAPSFENPATGEITAIPVPELDQDPCVFLWENPGLSDDQYLALWESIYIEGQHEAKGDRPAKSKNWIQHTITSGLKFPESRLAKLLKGGLTIENVAGLEDLPVGDVSKVVKAPQEDTVPTECTVTVPPEEFDPLAAAGLV